MMYHNIQVCAHQYCEFCWAKDLTRYSHCIAYLAAAVLVCSS